MDSQIATGPAAGREGGDSDDLRISRDKRSLVRKKNGWTWTFTPGIDHGN